MYDPCYEHSIQLLLSEIPLTDVVDVAVAVLLTRGDDVTSGIRSNRDKVASLAWPLAFACAPCASR